VATTAKQYDESLINFYEEQLVAHADAAYRFSFGLTLSLDGAQKIVRRTFQSLAASLETIRGHRDDAGTTFLLISECWKAYNEVKSQKFTEGQSAVTKALKALPLETRAALVAVDVAGLAPADAAKALGWTEKDLRVRLAAARRTMMGNALEL
jgi:hypothetical protein